MTNLKATVVIPTHDHASLLAYAVNSVFAQSIKAIEIFIIGDCVSNATREIIAMLMQKDKRIRFFDYLEKDPNVGELHRNKALQEARGEIICYLSDDDLWLPNHIEIMYEHLRNAEFSNTLPVIIQPHGAIQIGSVDLAQPFYRKNVLTVKSRIPLTFAAHTLEAYKHLPEGWQTTPQGSYSDHHMWKQFLKHQHFKANSSCLVTALNFPSVSRKQWKLEQREQELQYWQERINHPQRLAEFQHEIFTSCWHLMTWYEACYEGQLEILKEEQKLYKQQQDQLRSVWELGELEKQQLQTRLLAIENSLTWKIRHKILKIPVLAQLFRRSFKAFF